MTLIKCPGCGYPVSTEASVCHKCGAPIASADIPAPSATVQGKGKSLKAQEWLSALILIVGFILLAFNDYESSLGWLMALIGGGWAAITRIRIWWRHE